MFILFDFTTIFLQKYGELFKIKEEAKIFTLEELLKIDGVVVASEFSLDGKLLDSKVNLSVSQDVIEKKAQLCGVITMMFNAFAESFSELSKMNWVPQQCWMYAGGDWVVFIGGHRAVFVEREKADFNMLYQALC